jgi:hypothetical protein
MEARFFIVRPGGVEDGPFTEEEVLDLLDAGDLSKHDWCRVDSEPQAQPLGEIFETIRLTPADMIEETGEPNVGERENDSAEEVIYRAAPSLLGYAGPLSVAAGTLTAGYWAGAFGVAWVVGAVVIAFLLIARVLVHRAAREFVVTTERVESTCGLLAREHRTLRLAELGSIRLLSHGLLSWLGIGTVVFAAESDDAPSVVFERVARARRVIALVREWQIRGVNP